MRIQTLSTGTELMRGKTVDTNAGWIARTLEHLGLEVAYHATVGDDFGRLVEELKLAASRADVCIMSGGLGPTEDDLTRPAVEEALHRPLVFDRKLMTCIRERFRKYKIRMAAINRRQAFRPEGSRVLPNPNGSAPGFWLDAEGVLLFALPGPARELMPMFTRFVLPVLRRRASKANFAYWEGRTVGIPEGTVDEIVLRIVGTKAKYGLTVRGGLVNISLRAEGPHRQKTLSDLSSRIRRAIGDCFLAEGDRALEEVVGAMLLERRTTIAVAESVTGGLIAHKLTQVPGISGALLEAFVNYSNDSKARRLGVPIRTILDHGAVSEHTASAMAEGVARVSGAQIGVATTGIAGPGGGSKEKPVGLVYTAIRYRGRTRVDRRVFPGERIHVKERAANHALDLVRRTLMERQGKIGEGETLGLRGAGSRRGRPTR